VGPHGLAWLGVAAEQSSQRTGTIILPEIHRKQIPPYLVPRLNQIIARNFYAKSCLRNHYLCVHAQETHEADRP